ncbi:hypothetical protein HIM_10343 [Hirsutella minnesotensis 3608]|uniref:ABC transmembrane type-1 domain-containing protein n=1 Tax=Hirsutella minnesotensis 3608 TaxID=1043627 RepID=A0A0F7ZX81_9HYPO|nr:hypothetical protein HIM_10343 [Hirsutella minnesotensis 3608]
MLNILSAAARLCQPYIVQSLVNFLQGDQDVSIGNWLIVAVVFDFMAVALLSAHANQSTNQLGCRLRAYLTQRIFLRLHSYSFQSSSAPTRAVVLASVDVANVTSGLQMFFEAIPIAIIVGVGAYMLFRVIGLAFLAPFVLAIASLSITLLLSNQLQNSQRQTLEATETRLMALKQLLENPRGARIEGMESFATKELHITRQKEIGRMKAYRRVEILVLVVAGAVSGLSILASFGFYPLTKGSADLDYGVLFSSLAILSIMISPLLSFIQMLPSLFEGWVSWIRVLHFIRETLRDGPGGGNQPVRTIVAEPPPKVLGKGYGAILSFNSVAIQSIESEPFLREITFSLTSGEVAVILGPAGSGKSSLLKALLPLGELQITSGSITSGVRNISYCAQTPWFLENESIRDNVVLNKYFDQGVYNAVLDCCALEPDLANFDERENRLIVDHQGSQLSGGQRKRIALARALYAAPDLLLLDDVFAGLDPQTQSLIQRRLFGPHGWLASNPHITAILVSSDASTATGIPTARVFQLHNGQLLADRTPNNIEHGGDDGQITSDDIFAAPPGTDTAASPKEEPKEESQHQIPDATTQPVIPQEAVRITKRMEYGRYFRDLGLFGLVPVIILLLAHAGIEKGSPFWLSHWASQQQTGRARDSTGFNLGVYACFILGSVIALFGASWISLMQLIPNSGISIHERMVATLARSPASFIEETRPEILNHFTRDVEEVDLQLPLSLMNLVFAALALIGSVITLAISAPYILVFIIFLVPCLYSIKRLYLPTSSRLRTIQIASQAPVLNTFSSSIPGRETILAFGLGPRLAATLSQQVFEGQKAGYLFRSLQTWLLLVLELINAGLATVLASLLVGLKSHGKSQASIGWAGVALVNTVSMGTELSLLLSWWVRLEGSMGSIRRILEFVAMAPSTGVKPVDTLKREDGGVRVDNLTVTRG